MKAEVLSVVTGIAVMLLYIRFRDKKKKPVLNAWTAFCLAALIAWIPSNLFFQRHNYELIKAAEKGDIIRIKCAISAGADIHYPFRGGGTFLHLLAYQNGDPETAKFFIQQGISIYAKDDDGKTAYEIAIEKKNSKLAHYLFSLKEAMADPKRP